MMLSERQFQTAVMDYARLCGWAFYHTHNSRHSAAGFPDLCLVRNHRCIMAELKSNSGKLTADQEAWLKALDAVPGLEVFLWRPKDFGVIETTLKKEERPLT